jgi:hypothetical protein
MTFLSLMRALKKSPKSSQRRRPLWQAPLLESLEDRALPSTLTVTSAADDGSSGTLRAVLAAAHNGDTIVFSKKLNGQMLTLTAGQLQDNVSVQINGPGSNSLNISGNSASRILDIAAGANTTISGLTLSHGSATDGAGILNAGTLTLSQDVLTANVAQGIPGGGPFSNGRGGAVENQSGATLDVVKSTITGNQAHGAPDNLGETGYGGGIYNAGTTSVSQSVLTGNQAIGGPGGGYITSYGYTFTAGGGLAEGGAIESLLGTLSISGSTIQDNTAQGGPANSTAAHAGAGFGWGGGIASGGTTFSLTSSTLSGNQAVGGDGPSSLAYGGGLFFLPSQGGESATIDGTIFANNRAVQGPDSGGRGEARGGGGCVGAFGLGANLQMNNCIFTGNDASGDSAQAGGLSLEQASSAGSISNTTFTGNLSQGGFEGEAVGGGLLLAPGQTETLNNCNFAQNVAESIPGSTNVDAVGGGLYVSFTTAVANNCNFTQNTASTAASAPGAFFGSGADGLGGGIGVIASSLTLSNSTITGNQAIGGAGGPGGTGGFGRGAGLDAVGGSSVAINNTMILGNLAQAGAGGAGTPGGYAHGGGVYNGDPTITITNSILAGNSARGGAGGAGGAGGVSQGGGYYSTSFLALPTSVSFQNSIVTLNQATGGVGGSGASGGNADGGGLFIDAGTSGTLLSSAIIANQATGGAAGSGGSAGQGVGGGAYNLGTLDVDALSIIFANLASTSNNNVFGPITPI